MVARNSSIDDTEYQRLGLLLSTAVHLFIFLLVFLRFGSGWGDFQKPIVYSITIEGGKKLGGISQVPDEKNKTMIAPPKNTSSKEKKEEKAEKQEVKKEEKAKIPEAEKGEVQIKKKEAKEDKKSKDETKKKTEEKPKTKEKFDDVMQRYLGESSAAGATGFGAAALGPKDGKGGGTLISPEQLAYLNKIKEYVRSGFFWNDPSSDLQCDITFSVGTDGKISEPVISASSGNRSYDDAALRAVMKANPLPPPLASFYSKLNPVRINIAAQDL